MTDPAFCDASALVPFCLHEATSQRVRAYLRRHTPVVWWASRVEICGAVARLLRFGDIDPKEADRALSYLETVSRVWSEIHPDDLLRDLACELVAKYPLRAADSMQLAAALVWCRQSPHGQNLHLRRSAIGRRRQSGRFFSDSALKWLIPNFHVFDQSGVKCLFRLFRGEDRRYDGAGAAV